MDPDDELERVDDAIGASLRRRADELTGPIDAAASWADVEQQAGTRRRWRLAAASIGTAAAATIAVIGFLAVSGDEREVLRAPATQPSVGPVETVAPEGATTTPPTATPPSTAPVVLPPLSSPAVTMTPTTLEATDPTPSVTSYSSTGGSIDIRQTGAAITLDGDPSPAPGWTVQIDDDGPDRVRVRFERDGERSEIRIDLTADGRLEPRITEG